MVPPMASTSFRAMLRPSPVPEKRRLGDASACANLSKMRPWNDSGTPGPKSSTSMRITAASVRMRISTSAPDGENLAAFDSRFVITWMKRSGSTRMRSSAGVPSNLKRTANSRAKAALASIACSINSAADELVV